MTIDIEKLEWEVIEKLDPCNYEDTRRVINYLAARGYLGGAPEKNIKTFDAWFVFDGDVNGLAEFCDALNWNSFKKGGRDKKGNFVIFLVDGNESIGAIRSRSNKLHIAALDYLMGYAVPNNIKKTENINISSGHVDAVKVQDGYVAVPKCTVDKLTIAEKALAQITVYDLFDCSSVEDTDFQEQAKMVYEIAETALKDMIEAGGK